MNANLARQQGVTLVVGLIMLVLLTLMAVTSFKLGKSNLQVVGNMQFQNETLRAAEEAIEKSISTPDSVAITTTTQVDVNGDGSPDVTVTVTPNLVQGYIKKNVAINILNPDEASCGAPPGDGGIIGANSGNSLCAETVYDLKAVSTEAATGAKVEVHQGVAVQVEIGEVCKKIVC